MADDDGIPGWLGPIVGPLIGAFVVYKYSQQNSSSLGLPVLLALGAGLGLAAGLVVWWMDARKKNAE